MKKGTSAQIEERVNKVFQLQVRGHLRQEILQYASENWGVSARTADHYIQKSKQLSRENWDIERQDLLANLLDKYQRVYRQAVENNQLSTALGCLNAMGKAAQIWH